MTRVTVELVGNVGYVRLTRPEKLNAIDAEMIDELVAAGDWLATCANCRAVVLSGEGRGFCAGLDTARLRVGAPGRRIDIRTPFRGAANVAQHAALQWRKLPIPVIAAVAGAAYGGGLQLALGADIRIVHPEAQLSLTEVRWGLVPDMGGIVMLRDLLPYDRIADLVLTSRVVNGREAVEIGLATRLSDHPLQDAIDLARRIALLSPDAIRAAKRLIRQSGDEADLLRAESSEQMALIGTPAQREAVAAGIEKRIAMFHDPQLDSL